ncbi:MAG: M20/M25/M40 family metallo-hydrolase [Cyclobacteriaceae bacterium]|nr:M20/M25/M40 family metallo-hydrolase [Cyclobacteriaceae bacterium]
MMKIMRYFFLLCLALGPIFTHGQVTPEPVDTAGISAIRKEGLEKSQVMEMLRMLTDVHGPRLSFSPGYKAAANYAKETLENWGLSGVHFDAWGDIGRGWYIKKYSLDMISPSYSPLVGYPKAWSPGVKGNVSGDLIFLDIATEGDLLKYKGKLKGKFVMMDLPSKIKIGWDPEASRLTDSALLKYANDETSKSSGQYRLTGSVKLIYKTWKMCMEEGVVAVISPSPGRGDNGAMTISGAYLPIPPETPVDMRPRIISPGAPATLPQVALLSEHYNRLYRLLTNGTPVKLDLTLNVAFTPAEEGFNVIAEIPGSDLKDEIVMIGAHLDSWHSGTGTTDNGTGSAVCLEVMRIIKSLGIQPRRTIRIGLWGGEEQGLLGSKGYVKKHLGDRVDGKLVYTPDASRFSVYFNMDNGTGKFRGIYLQQNESARNIFKEWFKPFHSMGAATITASNTGGTDHLSFVGIGLPGFQFIQDPVEYSTRTHHTNLDVYDKALDDDLKQNSIILASFAWLAANRSELMPRPASTE